MKFSASRPHWTFWPALGLALAFLGVSLWLSLMDSPTSDEPPHLAAGLCYLKSGDAIRGNPQHPPLLKELSAVSMLMGGVRWPETPAANALLHSPDPARAGALEWGIGNEIIRDQGPDRVMFWGRLPLVLVGTMLVAVLYLWGRQMVGPVAALGAVFLCVLDPVILAHAHLITTDVGIAAFTMLFLFALWNYLRDPNWKRLVLSGLALGAAMTVKFSGVFLPPIAGVLLFAGALWPLKPVAAPEKRPASRNEPCPCGSGKKYKHCHGAKGESAAGGGGTGPWRRLALCGGALAAICAAAFLVIQIVYLLPADPLVYSKVRFTSYFAAAWLLKAPLASIALAAMGLVVLLRSRVIPRTGKAFLLLPPLVFFLAATIWADGMGVRYIMPAFPFAHLWGGLALATLIQSGARWGRVAAAALCGWVAMAAAGAYPNFIPYFNEAACLLSEPGALGINRGTRCGPHWLDDSNVEWGQGLKQVKAWLDRNANGRTARMGLFTPFPPQAYGIRCEKLTDEEMMREPGPGLYVISAHIVTRLPAYGGVAQWMRRIRPSAIIADSYYVYDIPGT